MYKAKADDIAKHVKRSVEEAQGLYHRLILVVGEPRTGKTTVLQDLAEREGWPLLSVNLHLTEALLELTRQQRTLRASRLLGDLVGSTHAQVVLLDNIEVLFDPELKQDPLRLLQGLARQRTIVVAWPGTMAERSLTYAEPAHPEHKKYANPDAVIISTNSPEPHEEANVLVPIAMDRVLSHVQHSQRGGKGLELEVGPVS